MGVIFNSESNERNPEVKPYNAIRPITASATVMKVTDKAEIIGLSERKASQKWQEEAWEYFDAIGEIKYAFNLFANILSRIRIHAAYVENDQDAPTPIKVSNASDYSKEAADKAMRAVFGGGKQAEILRKSGINMLVVGECYLISETTWAGGYQKTKWRVVSTDELIPMGKGFGLKNRRNRKQSEIQILPPDTFMGRIWREHPRYSDEPDSSMRALCDLCNELLLLSRTVRATARSRLNAGALLVPDELDLSDDVTTDPIDDGLDAYVEDDHEAFEENLMDHMTTPISDEGSAAAAVPIVIRGSGESLDKIRLIKFERSFDPQLVNRADRALERILQGIELPKEIVTGLSNIKYSNAIQINESFYTAHIEPLVLMLCDVYRTVYLEPALMKAGVDPEEIDKIVIWYDPSGITTAPDKSTAANVGYDKNALSADAWRRANGFTEDDAPSAMETAMKIAINRGPVTPEFMDTVLKNLVPELLQATRENTLEGQEAPIPDSVDSLINGGAQAPPADPTETADMAPDGLIEPDAAPADPTQATAQAPGANPATDATLEEPAVTNEAQSATSAEPEIVSGDFAEGFTEDNAEQPAATPEGENVVPPETEAIPPEDNPEKV